jgi:hypothetical protein
MTFSSNSGYITSNQRMLSERWFKKNGRNQSWLNLRYYPSSFLEGLTKITKSVSHYMRCRARDLNMGLTEYEAGVLTTRPQCSFDQSCTWILIGPCMGHLLLKKMAVCRCCHLWIRVWNYSDGNTSSKPTKYCFINKGNGGGLTPSIPLLMPVDKVTSKLHGESSIQKDMQASLSLFRFKAAVLNQGLQPQRVQGDSSGGRPNVRCKPYTSSFPFPFVPLQRRGCLVAPLFLWIVLVPCAGD